MAILTGCDGEISRVLVSRTEKIGRSVPGRVKLMTFCSLTSQKLHGQVGVGEMVRSVSLGGVIVSILTGNVRDVRSIPALGAIFPIFNISHDTGCFDDDPVQATHFIVVEPTLCMYM